MSFRPPGRSPKASLVRGARRAGAAVTCLALPRFNWPDRCRASVFLRVLRDSDSVRSQDRNDLWGVRATARPIRRIAFCVVASNDQFERSNMTARRILIVAFCLIAAGCAALDANESPPRVVPPPPEGKKLVELVKAAFTMAKLSGAPEVSQVRAAHDTQRGDWTFCVKTNSPDDSPKYAVLVANDAILEVRSFVLIDGCDKETYHPIEITDRRSGSAGGHADPAHQSQRRH